MKLIITNQDGDLLHEQLLVPGGEGLKIGRSGTCQIKLESLSISREHVLLQMDSQGVVMIQDLQSTYGTFVDGKKIQPAFFVQLNPGIKVQLSDEAFLSIELEKDEDFPPLVNEPGKEKFSPMAIFPFFMSRNERFVRDAFHGLRSKTSESSHSEINIVEESIFGKVRELSAILEVSYALNSLFSYQSLLEYTIDMAIKVTGAERGFIMLYNDESDRLETVVVRRMGSREVEADMKASSSLVLKCFRSGETVVIEDTNANPETSSNKSILANRIRSAALTPLKIKNSVIGVLYLDNRISANIFSDKIQDLMRVFAAQASVAINNARLFHMATTDSLTSLMNHKQFHQRVLEEFYRSIRHQKPLSLLMIDIDNFKAINDQHGNVIGDRVLKMISRILKVNMRVHDLAARYGEDEFGILLPETNSEGAYILGEKLRKIVDKANFKIGHNSLKISVSIGVGVLVEKMTKPIDLIRASSSAVQKAKKMGRNCVIEASEEETTVFLNEIKEPEKIES